MSVLWATKPNVTGTRAEHDFYPTPIECTLALLPHIEDFPHIVWEPACGDGAISKVLLAADRCVVSSDISPTEAPADRGLNRDFLCFEKPLADAIVTNPPYSLAEEFIRKAFDLGCMHIAMLLKANFWHAKRGGLFEQYTPSRILPLTWRPDFTGKGSPFLDVAWNVWRPGCASAQMIRLARPSC